MKKLSSILLLAIIFTFSSFDVKDAVFYRKEHYQKELWYPIMINKLKKENRADVFSAEWMGTLSSAYYPGDKTGIKAIERFGKINEQEIRVMFRESEKDPSVYVFVETSYCILDLFVFNTTTAEFKRIQNKGIIVMHFGDRLSLKENTKEGLLFYDDYDVDGSGRAFRNHIYFNRAENSLKQIKSCEIVKGIEQCKEAK